MKLIPLVLVLFWAACEAEGVHQDSGSPTRGPGAVDSSVDTVILDAGTVADIVSLPVDRLVDTFQAVDVGVVGVEVGTGDVQSVEASSSPDLAAVSDLMISPDLMVAPDLSRLGLGKTCKSAEQCTSGHCVSGVCCADLCTGGCNVGCGSEGQCLSCSTCSCSAVTGQCHC